MNVIIYYTSMNGSKNVKRPKEQVLIISGLTQNIYLTFIVKNNNSKEN
jgi:hypothetical protein